ncbi:MAG: hypothetical protein OJF50_000220 [Nitrospira sp.]|nr:hypothetical protein [Nitrospira sp.]
MDTALNGLRALVVDDDEDVRTALVDALIKAGCSVSVACDGKQGLERIMKRKFDVIITDLQMPIMNGLALLAFIQKQSLPIPVVVVSGAGQDLEQIAIERGAFAFIRKPFTPQTVLNMVRRATRPDKVGQDIRSGPITDRPTERATAAQQPTRLALESNRDFGESHLHRNLSVSLSRANNEQDRSDQT